VSHLTAESPEAFFAEMIAKSITLGRSDNIFTRNPLAYLKMARNPRVGGLRDSGDCVRRTTGYAFSSQWNGA